jgi:spore maturation protein CgeB
VSHDIAVIGLSITSSWGNGHATTYRSLLRQLAARGHRITFLERDLPWYAEHRDLPRPGFCRLELYAGPADLEKRFTSVVSAADVVLVGSYVPEGIAVGEWVCATARGLRVFYDIDTPVTLASLERGDAEYISRELVAAYDLYLSFTGGPTLARLERELGARDARALYCSVDPDLYRPEPRASRWDLGYLGTYSDDRQPLLERLLTAPAAARPQQRFVVAGAQYPASIRWPANVERFEHVAPPQHCAFYNEQRLTLNVTRADMRAAGYSPSVRLFEAAACGTPIISDSWPGLETFFEPGTEALIASSSDEVLDHLGKSPAELQRIAERARRRVLEGHTAKVRAQELEEHVRELRGDKRRSSRGSAKAC